MIVLVTGGRDFADFRCVGRVLDEAHSWERITRIITGCAAGADRWARNWALLHEVDAHVYAARWRAEGNKAGPLRNARMLADGRPDLVIAFPGGRGTADMVRRAAAAGVPVVKASPGGPAIDWRSVVPPRREEVKP